MNDPKKIIARQIKDDMPEGRAQERAVDILAALKAAGWAIVPTNQTDFGGYS